MEDVRGGPGVVRSSSLDELPRLAKSFAWVLEHVLHSVGTFALGFCRILYGLGMGLLSLLRGIVGSKN